MEPELKALDCAARLSRLERPDLGTALPLRVPQIIGHLHPEPGLGRSPKGCCETDSKLGAHRSATIHDPGQRDPGHFESLCEFRNRKPPGSAKNRALKNLARMRRIVHASHSCFSVIVQVVDENRIRAFERESHAPVFIDPNRPVSRQLALQG
jgi:hypothetical protein